MEENSKTHIDHRTLLHGIGALAGVVSADHAMMGGTQSSNPMKPSGDGHDKDGRASSLTIPTWYYQQFDADCDLDVPEEGFGGWRKTDLEFSRKHIAVVVMHAWDMGTREKFPGWWRAVPYAPRSQTILREVFPELLRTVRRSAIPLFHVVGVELLVVPRGNGQAGCPSVFIMSIS
jgi:hypothetical protein